MEEHHYFPKQVVYLSLFVGLVAALFSKLVFTWREAGLFGAIFALAMMVVLPLSLRRNEKKYANVENEINEKSLFKEFGNFRITVDGKSAVRNGCLLVAQEHLYIFSRDSKPYIHLTYGKDDIRNIIPQDNTNIIFYPTKDDPVQLTVQDMKSLTAALIHAGWVAGFLAGDR